MTKGTAIQLQNLHKRFADGPPVLAGLDFSVGAGEIVSFVGPSGCGKSTLLRLAAGLIAPTRGRICFDRPDRDSTGNRAHTAFIFQSSTLLPWLNVRGNIATALQLKGMPRKQRHERARALAELVHLEEVLEYYPRQLSGGMQMRVSIARALSLSPQLLLLDEPFGALDAITRQQLNEELLLIHQREKWTALFVTHSVNEAVFLSHRVVILSSLPGKIVTTVEIPMAFPRSASTRNEALYQECVKQTNLALQGVLATV